MIRHIYTFDIIVDNLCCSKIYLDLSNKKVTVEVYLNNKYIPLDQGIYHCANSDIIELILNDYLSIYDLPIETTTHILYFLSHSAYPETTYWCDHSQGEETRINIFMEAIRGGQYKNSEL